VQYSFEGAGSQYIHNINAESFENIALALFHHQYEDNPLYRLFTDTLRVSPADVTSLSRIPFLPISFFRTHKVVTGMPRAHTLCFESSGTTGEITSKHYVFREELYRASLLEGFKQFYGDPNHYAILALLPSYLERQNASLVHMTKVLMEHSSHPANGFYLNEWKELAGVLGTLEASRQPALLLGVTFALLDFAEAAAFPLRHTTIMETGGMKGRKQEWTRQQVHESLKQQLGVRGIHSEYGMTELLSQAYAKKDGYFKCAATMKVLVRDINDPLDVRTAGMGCLNVIDLANVDSCAFIATDDIGHIHPDGHFEVLGRLDHSALRGCSLMAI
jgi:hypothetical protein